MTGKESINELSKLLKMEADVEIHFVMPLLQKLGFSNSQIKGKHSLESLAVKSVKGTKKENYRPDFAIVIGKKTRLIIEVKSPKEKLENHISQPREYAAILNGEAEDVKPVKYFLLTNRNLTLLFKHDLNDPILEMVEKDFSDGNRKYEQLKSYLSKDKLLEENHAKNAVTFTLRKPPLQKVNEAFAWCHQYIYRSDHISQGAAFMEFVKLIALKLSSDRDLREKYPSKMNDDEIEFPVEDVKFSQHWLDERIGDTPNPMDTIWFQKFISNMELEIQQKKRRRIFAAGDHINLSPETISGVVKKLEDIFLFGIDADLNGRLFETFLNATMRGKDLGQYFTPRSVVKLGVGLAQLKVDPAGLNRKDSGTDKVIDACCGTGGFLVDALADMFFKVDQNASLTAFRKVELKKEISNYHIYGIDIGRDPNLCRIARLNMLLHGDGGSSIFNMDSLDKNLPDLPHESPDVISEKEELRKIYKEENGFFDVALTNPPFAKAYETEGKSGKDESTNGRILSQYELTTWPDGKNKKSLKSSLMFYERYYDLLVRGGRLISVIDDGLLSGSEYAWFRNYLRQKFIIRAVVSLPGDAFQRSKARVKTSIIVLTKKRSETEEQQTDVFMYPCRFVGIDDPARQRTMPIDEKIRESARKEIREVLLEYNKYTEGKAGKRYIVPAHKVQDRLDVKHCLMNLGESVPNWKKKGLTTLSLSDLVEPKNFSNDDIIVSADHEGTVRYLRVRYDGGADVGDEVEPGDTTYSHMYRVRNGDIVISNIAATYGSVAVVDETTDGCVVASEYTVLTTKDNHDPITIWTLMRSKEVRADMLLAATGANRTRVRWENIKDIKIPYPKMADANKLANALRKIKRQEKELHEKKQAVIDEFSQSLLLNGHEAEKILQAFKPPK